MTTNTIPASPNREYSMGYSEEVITFLARAAERVSPGFLLPHLQPGMQLLDVGCGPGFLSARLATAIAPGHLHGIDIEPSQIELARAVAHEREIDNATYVVADAIDLPFADNSFDVVHFAGVLLFTPDIASALAESRRVLKPGGIVACREMMVDSCYTHPELGVMRRAWEIFADLIEADDGHAQMGRELKARLIEAGFVDVTISAAVESYSTAEELDIIYRVVKQSFLDGEPAEAAKKYGAATNTLLETVTAAFDDWRSQPGATAGLAFGQAIARNL